MEQKNIRPYNGLQYSTVEGAEIIKELDDRTKYADAELNSMQSQAEAIKDLRPRIYETIALMLVQQHTHTSMHELIVLDASADNNITFPDGEARKQATYRYKGIATNSVADYRLEAVPYGNIGGSEADIVALQEGKLDRGTYTTGTAGDLKTLVDGTVSGYKGYVAIAALPTEDGMYSPQAGIHTNKGGLVYAPEGADKGFDVKFIKTGASWVKDSVKIDTSAFDDALRRSKTTTEPLSGTYATKPLLTAAFPSGNSNLYLVVGDIKEVDTLTITGAATANGNFGVVLNGVTVYTAVISGDSPEVVAGKIRANTQFQGWVISGTGASVIFTDSTSRVVSAPTANPTATGITYTLIRTTTGVAPDGNWYYWSVSAWVSGGTYLALLNSIQDSKLETLNKTHTAAVNELNAAKNKLDLQVEKLEEKQQPFYIEMGAYTMAADAPSTNANAIIAVTDTTSNILTGDFSVWGATKQIAGVVEYTDGTYGTNLINSYNTTTATFAKPFTKDVAKASCMHDAVNGQHLSDIGFYAMAQHLFNYPKRTAFRQELVKGMNMQNHARLSVSGNHVIFKNTLTNKTSLEIDALGSYNPAFINVANSSLAYFKLSALCLELSNTFPAIIGGGYEITHNADYTGYVELFLGTDLSLSGKICEVKLLKDGVAIETIQFSGGTKQIILNHEVGNYKIQVVAVEAAANPKLSGIFFWKKRETITPIWKKSDRILFLTDSWGAYPEAVDPELKPKQFDGTRSSGMSYMPIKFKEYFEEMGGNPNNVFLATRGGQTSEWAQYWLPFAIRETMPTKIVFNFGVNDLNSTDEYAGGIPSSYDFDPDVMFASMMSNAGGVFGSVDKQRYADNIKFLADYCVSKGITPIFFMPPKVASVAQTLNLQKWALEIYAEGLK